ncbi:MAG: hypothetical protein IJS12_06015 [Lachnospiraceae bacterium]|nr:hypothetical protein [Lachnospiraceae bacterium]
MADTGTTNIVKYRRPRGINVGILVFVFILIELIVAISGYLNTKHISPYEVRRGSLYKNSLYTGIALRDEEVVTAADSGYINYYVREGQHVAVGDLIYTIDETGRLSESAADTTENNSLTDSDLARIRTDISGFSASFSEKYFSEVYSFKNSLYSKAVELTNYDILNSLSGITDINSSLVHYRYAPKAGVVTYTYDGFEEKKLEDITAEDFDQAEYSYTQMVANNLVAGGDTIYKLCTNEDWMIVIQTDPDTAALLSEMEYVEVRFSRNQYTSWAAVSQYVDSEGNYYIGLTFTNSMITFAMDRFINIELLMDNSSGLKIPNSSIATKDFYVVPKDFVTTGPSGKQGVMLDSVDDEGNSTVEFIETSIYSETEDEYFLDDLQLRNGDLIYKPNPNEGYTDETYTIRLTDSLQGVYNINKGYAEFKEVNILYSNDDYSIVKPNTTYGLNEYDYIVLDSSTVLDGERLYE